MCEHGRSGLRYRGGASLPVNRLSNTAAHFPGCAAHCGWGDLQVGENKFPRRNGSLGGEVFLYMGEQSGHYRRRCMGIQGEEWAVFPRYRS